MFWFCSFHFIGKTTIVQSLLRFLDELHPGVYIEKVMICYGAWQNKYDQIQDMLGERVVFVKGLPSHEEIMELTKNHQTRASLLCIDDLMDSAAQSPLIRDIFVSIAHHRNLYTW